MNGDMAARQCYRVKKDYVSPYPNALEIRVGETLAVSDKKSEWAGWLWCTNSDRRSGWIPESRVERTGDRCRVLRDFTTRELSVRIGERLVAEREESGWLWCVNERQQSGWVPQDHLEELKPEG